MSGVNLLELLLDMVQNKQIIPEFNNYQKNLLVMKEVAVRQRYFRIKSKL